MERELHKILRDNMEWFPLTKFDSSIKIVRRDLVVPKIIGLLSKPRISLQEAYKEWCKETKRGGSILIGNSIREFFTWYERKYNDEK